VQKLLYESCWEADVVLGQHMDRVGNNLGFENGMLVFDETGFLKKGTKSAGVARQYTGTAGKIENAQVGVFAAWKSELGQTLIDRELYLPEEWTSDRRRCQEAKIPDSRPFMTKNKLAEFMYLRIMSHGFKPAYVLADSVYGRDWKFRQVLEDHQQPYILGVPSDQRIDFGSVHVKMSEYAKRFNRKDWKRRSAGDGTKGPRLYDWAMESVSESNHGFKRIVLFRKNIKIESEIAYYFGYVKVTAKLDQIIQAAGSRWSVEECFESAKGEVGLDQYEVRSWIGWYRHITLSMIAHSFLVITKNRIFRSSPQRRKSFEDFKKKRLSMSASVFKNSESCSSRDF
jgi:SRSO17 transposase